MIVKLEVPSLGESITEVEVGNWHKSVGEAVARDEAVVELESEKATVELPAPEAGTLRAIFKQSGQPATVGEVIGELDTEARTEAAAAPPGGGESTDAVPAPAPSAHVMPAAQRVLAQAGLAPAQATPTGPGGRLLKEDAERAAHTWTDAEAPTAPVEHPAPVPVAAGPAPQAASPTASTAGTVQAEVARSGGANRGERVVRMSVMRRTIASRLVEAQHSAALLTTFNEVDMTEVIALRRELGDAFRERHGVKLGFMSFFVTATVTALQKVPEVNAAIRDENMVFHDFCDIGIAIGSGKGLVVPVLRNAEGMTFADIEQHIADLAARARAGALALEELQGGTFTISNGGIYGSVLSTPIVNPPQSGILGLHAISDRAVPRAGQVVIRPIMNVALTYDHRIIDGREAVTFLKTVKENVENPSRVLLGI
jgi:2-oxoglutarate dehydrogenase E2 component (dihydrolipoamide succinyltransferase)